MVNTIKTRVRIFRPGTPPEDREVEFDDDYMGLRTVVMALLDGAHLEHVAVEYEGQRRDMFVDEIGQMKNLPVNGTATAIYRSWWLRTHPTDTAENLPDVVGPAILFLDRIVWE